MGERTTVSAAPLKAPQPQANPSPSLRETQSLFGLQQTVGNQALLGLFDTDVIRPKLRVSQPGDADEIEADHVAGKIAARAEKPGNGIHRHENAPILTQARVAIHRAPSDQAPAQAAPADPVPGSPKGPDARPPLLVEDDAAMLAPGQMKKTQFMRQLAGEICETADAILVSVGRTANACPYIRQWLGFYSAQSGSYIERALHKYAPETAGAAHAEEYIAIVREHVRRAVAAWAQTGKVTGVPPGVPIPPEAMAPPANGGAAKSGKEASSEAPSGAAPPNDDKVQTKLREPGDSAGAQIDSVRERLGSGRPLDPAVRSRMEPAFGQDFSRVRLHTDPQAEALSSDLKARAFTLGENVVFASGEYRPGTPVGDALIAHELAHVVQQGHSTPAAAPMLKGQTGSDILEEDADQTAMGAVVSLWTGAKQSLAGLSKNALPQLRSGLRLQRCSIDKRLKASDVTPDLTVTKEQADFMEELEGLETTVYPAYRNWVFNQKTIPMSTMGVPAEGAAGAQAVMLLQDKSEEKLIAALRDEGLPPDPLAFKAQVTKFENLFANYAKNEGFQILAENERLVQGELKHYSGDPAKGGVADLKAALEPFRKDLAQAKKAGDEAIDTDPFEGLPVVNQAKIEEATKLEDPARKALVLRFPIVADKSFDLSNFFLSSSDQDRQQRVVRTVQERLDDIQKTRGTLQDDPSKVWKFDHALERARRDLHIQQGSIFDLIIQDKLANIQADEMFKSVLVGALAIGLGLLSAGEGTIAVLAAAGAAGVSVGTAVSHIQEFLIESAAHGSAFDEAQAISSQEPGLFWLALDIVFAIVDLGAAARAFAALKSVAPTIKVAADAEKLRAPAEAAVKEGLKAKLPAEAVAKEEAKIAEEAKSVADQIVNGAKKHLSEQEFIAAAEKADAAAVAAVKAVVKDEAAVSGLLKIAPATRTRLLSSFANHPGVLERLGHFVEESDQFAKTVERLSSQFPEKQFKDIVSKYMLTKSEEAPYILRALSDAGVSDEDFKAIAQELATTKSSRQVGKKFATAAIDKIADRLPAGPQGISDLRKATAGLHPNQSGTIFEKWAAKNVFGKVQQRFSTATQSLAEKFKSFNPKFHDSKIILDDMRSAGNNKAVILEYKHYRLAGKFGDEAKNQAEDIAELIRIGAKNEKGEVFTSVEYLFSSREAAAANELEITSRLGDRATIFFVDDSGKAVKFVPGGTP